MRRKLTLLGLACIVLALLGLALVVAVNAAPAGWMGTCRITPVVEFDGELYRVRCGNGEIKVLEAQPAPRYTATSGGAEPTRIIVEPPPYPPPPQPTPNPYP